MKKKVTLLVLIGIFFSCQIFAQQTVEYTAGRTHSFKLTDQYYTGTFNVSVVPANSALRLNTDLPTFSFGKTVRAPSFDSESSSVDFKVAGLPMIILTTQGGGNVRIGYASAPYATNFKLAVNGNTKIEGTLDAKEINVKADVWSDFVFADDYQLKSLNEVEDFIKTNKHLPDVPSATQVTEKGINVAEMNAILLQKIEENTLYIISLQNEINMLKEQLNSYK